MSTEPSLHVVGISHHTAGVELRELFSLSPAEVTAWLERAREGGRTALLLSTCNRCELYWYGDGDHEPSFREFARVRGVADEVVLERWEGLGAVQHVFTVAAGLDSQVLGETEILGQVRRAYDLARAAGTTAHDMDLVFSAALSAGRRVRRETMLGRHPSSVSTAAVEIMAECWAGGALADARVVVLGAGEAAEGVLRALHARGATRVDLVNRHLARAATLAAAWNATPRGWDELPELAAEADLLAVATSSSRPVLSTLELEAAMARRAGRAVRALIVVDLSVPRNVEPAARQIAGIRLFDLDDLQRLCCPAAEAPSAALAEAERILTEEIGRLEQSLRGRAAAPQLAELHRLGVEMAAQETAWALDQLAELSEREREIVREMADRLVRRVLYPVSRSIRMPQLPQQVE
ncbi:MAG: glutamyl-tRNA reductase [Gemmatimonadales bacterium]